MGSERSAWPDWLGTGRYFATPTMVITMTRMLIQMLRLANQAKLRRDRTWPNTMPTMVKNYAEGKRAWSVRDPNDATGC
jgi:hypothetical protein